FQIARLRIEREGNIYRVSLDDHPAVGMPINYTGEFESIQLGLTAGIPAPRTLNTRARLDSVKLAGMKPLPRGDDRPKAPPGGVEEDFRLWKVGELPAGWESSRLGNLAIQPGVQGQGLELISKAIPAVLADSVKLPALDLRSKF